MDESRILKDTPENRQLKQQLIESDKLEQQKKLLKLPEKIGDKRGIRHSSTEPNRPTIGNSQKRSLSIAFEVASMLNARWIKNL